MKQWLEELFRELHPRATVEEIDSDIKQKPQEASARYLAFLGLLAEARALPAGQAGRRRRAAGPRRDRGRPRARRRQLAHLRPADRGGRRTRHQSQRFLRARPARSLPSRVRARQAVRIARRVRAGLVRQESSLAPGRPRRCLRLADHDPRRSRGDAAGRAPPRHRGQHRHVEPQALSVGRGSADPRMALQRRLRAGPDRDAGRRRADGPARSTRRASRCISSSPKPTAPITCRCSSRSTRAPRS